MLLRAADYRRLLIGQLVSGLGDWLATFAFMALIFNLTGKASDVAFILVLRLIPPIFVAPIGGVLADRLPRRTMMIVADLIRAGIIMLVPFSSIGLVYLLAFLHECMSLVFLPARDALIPRLVARDKLEIGNGFMLASGNATLPLAGAVFSLLEQANNLYPSFLPFATHINRYPETLAFFLDAATFVFSAGMIGLIRTKPDWRIMKAHQNVRFFQDFAQDFRAVLGNARLRRLAYGTTITMFGGGTLFAVGVGYVRQTLHQSNEAFGWLISLCGVGMAIGLIGIRYLSIRHGRMYIFTLAVLVIGAILVSMSMVPVPVIAFALAAPFGVAFASALILAMTLAQELADDHTRGTVMGSLQGLFNLGLGLGALSIGFAATIVKEIHLFGLRIDNNQFALFIGGTIICLGALVTFGMTAEAPMRTLAEVKIKPYLKRLLSGLVP